MQVLMGPTYNMDVSVSASSSSPACVGDRSSSGGVSASSASASAAARDSNKCNEKAGSSSCLFLNGGDGDGDEDESDIVGDPTRRTYGSDELSDSSSSIGAPGDSEEEEDGVVVSSSKEKDGVGGLTRNKFSMSSLEDSLLNKRGLSNHYSGKSKSFGNLAEAVPETSGGGAKQVLEKEENPFNKRRRIFIANRLSRKFFYSNPTHRNRKSMPLLPVLHDDDEEETEEEGGGDIYKHQHQQQRHDDDDEHQLQQQYQYGSRLKLMINNSMRYKSQSCFCLADLGEEEEEEEEGEQQQQHHQQQQD